jgi:hypothetical protein
VASENLDRFVERQQMPADGGEIGMSGCHRPNLPSAMRAASAASIFRRWGR